MGGVNEQHAAGLRAGAGGQRRPGRLVDVPGQAVTGGVGRCRRRLADYRRGRGIVTAALQQNAADPVGDGATDGRQRNHAQYFSRHRG